MALVKVKRRKQGLKFRKALLIHWSSHRKSWLYPFIPIYWHILSNAALLKGLKSKERCLGKLWPSRGCWKSGLSLVESMRNLRVGWGEGQSSLSLNFKQVQRQPGSEGTLLWAHRSSWQPSKDSRVSWYWHGQSVRLFENRVVAVWGKARTTLVICCRQETEERNDVSPGQGGSWWNAASLQVCREEVCPDKALSVAGYSWEGHQHQGYVSCQQGH